MKVLYSGSKVLGTATDDHIGLEDWVFAPEGFDVSRLDEYTMVNGVPTLPSLSITNKTQAQSLLQATDWVELPSVTNIANTPHLLNASEFEAYRTQVRAIAVNPPDTAVTWPTIPTEQWSS